MKLQLKASEPFKKLPEGDYYGKFLGVTLKDTSNGKSLYWQFEIIKGGNSGSKVGLFTGTDPSAGNKAGKFLIGMTGQSKVGQEIDLSTYVNNVFLITLTESKDGKYTNVSSVCSLPKQQ